MVGQTLGHDRLDERIGAGGMGHVYEDARLGPRVAIQVFCLVVCGLCLVSTGLAEGQSSREVQSPPEVNPGASVLGVALDGPPPPVPPEVVSRDAQGRVTMRAVRLEEGLVLDGRLDERVYATVPAASEFVQQEPHEGELATEQTEVWVFYDNERVYVAARCWDSQPDRIVANEMRRDSVNIWWGDHFAVSFDPYYSRRSGVFFQTNALGAIRDGLVDDETKVNYDWNTVWDVKSRRFSGGWTTEMAIPFKSLRYREGRTQIWGITVQRVVRSKNEFSYLNPMPASYGGQALFRFSAAAILVGIEPPPRSRNAELKPYVISDLTTDREATPPVSADLDGAFGFDAKYGLTRSLTFDFTYNTDFAQVEIDEQQVNLTRFNLFFPEKREFFLEGQGIFEFGGTSLGPSQFGGPSDMPILFFSRRIGLNRGETVPIQVGGRLTGRVGKYTVGLLNIQTEDAAHADAVVTNFSVVRLKRDVLRRSTIGLIATGRFPSISGEGSNQVYGVDANLAFFQNLEISSYYARTETPGLPGDAESYQAQLRYAGDRYGVELQQLKVGEAFNPEVGFLRRHGFRRQHAKLRFSPRLRASAAIRKVSWEASLDYITNGAGQLETRQALGTFRVDLENGDTTDVNYVNNYEFLTTPFPIAEGVLLPIGGYRFNEVQAGYQLGPQRKIKGRLSLSQGSFYSGDRTEVGYSFGRVEVTPQLAVEPRLSFNWVDLPEGNFTTELVGARTTYVLTPRMFVSALLQYNSGEHALESNVRLRWEYQPGSELFVVYSEGRDAEVRGFPGLENRAFVVKFNRLFRF